jgi:hypothetical protein
MSTPLSTAELDAIEAMIDDAQIIIKSEWYRKTIRGLLNAARYYMNESDANAAVVFDLAKQLRVNGTSVADK